MDWLFTHGWRGPITPEERLRTRKVKAIPHKSGIYLIRSKTTNYFYIGSTIDLHNRIRNHLLLMTKEYYHHLQQEFNLYGIDDLLIYILETDIPQNQLAKHENIWIDANIKNPFNLNLYRSANHRFGDHAQL